MATAPKKAPSPNVDKFSGTSSARFDPKFQPNIPKVVGQRILIVVESPKKMSKIASYLPKDNNYKLLPSVGHIAELTKEGRHNLGLDIDEDYKPNFVLSAERKDVCKAIVDAAKTVDKILIATDPDREGEHIGFSVMELVKEFGKPIKRIEIHEITKKGVTEALANERDLDLDLIQAAISRRVLDRVVGFLASPLVIKRLGKGLSAGRVQSVALRLLVDRELEIEGFDPEEYWVIQSNLKKSDSIIPIGAKLHGSKVTNKADASVIKTELESSSYTVSNIEAKEVKKYPPTPITTSRLQMLASSRYSFGGQRAMKAAQRLYEEGLITYIRTDSVRQSDEAIDDIRSWLKANKATYLPTAANVYKNKGAAQDAHESIRPTHIEAEPKSRPATDEEKLYKLIWEITVASQMTPALYDTTTVTITTDKKRELKTVGKILRDSGWLSVTQYAELDKEDEADAKLPPVAIGDVLTLTNVTAEQKFTQPPKRYSEGSLTKELEKKGIGRPSTYADITNKILVREYVIKKGNSLVATDVGKKLIAFLCEYFEFMEYDYTSNLEAKLDHIANGDLSYLQMMTEFYPNFKDTIDKVYFDTNPDENKFTCDKCGKGMYVRRSTFGNFLGCCGYPYCKNAIPCETIDGKVVISTSILFPAPDDQKCPTCDSSMVIKNGKFGEFYSCSTYPSCKGWRKIPFGKKCPDCNNELYRTVFNHPPHQGPVLCCMSYPKCKYVEDLQEYDAEVETTEVKKPTYKDSKKDVEKWRETAFSSDKE